MHANLYPKRLQCWLEGSTTAEEKAGWLRVRTLSSGLHDWALATGEILEEAKIHYGLITTDDDMRIEVVPF